jgi:nitrate reductase gamma subunit
MRTIIGLAMVLAGTWLLILIVSFAAMIDPAPGAEAWWSEVVDTVVVRNGLALLAGIVLILAGLLLALRRRRPEKIRQAP